MVANSWQMPGSVCPSSCSLGLISYCPSLFSHHSLSIPTYSGKTERRSRLSQSLSQKIDSILGLRYHAMLPTADVSNLPSPARAFIDLSRNSFVTADRGNVRRRNDATLESRARHFTAWLETAGFTVDNFNLVDVMTFPSLLAAYLTAVTAGDNCLHLSTLGPASLRGYVTAASDTITMLTAKPCSYLDPQTLASKRPKLLPMLSEIIQQRGAWKEPLPRKEPFTIAMLDALRAHLQAESKKSSLIHVFLTSVYAAYDWIRLGVFTGSRISEYGQSSSGKAPGARYARIPNSRDAGVWANQPLAFIAADFVFFNKESLLVDRQFCLLNTALDHIYELHLRFRFDKSKTNLTIRKYTRLLSAPFDPVVTAINIIRRAHILGIPPNEPLGQYRNLGSTANSMLRDSDIRNHLRLACRLAYPDPRHYCRIHILGLVAHSSHVTAALCLKLGGTSDEEIAFRLRWHVSSVPTYLRECFNGFDQVMQTAINGVFQTV